MPKGVPVATVAIDGSQNAALLVLQMIGITNADIASFESIKRKWRIDENTEHASGTVRK